MATCNRLQKHVIVIAPHRADIISGFHKLENDVQYPLTVRAAIDIIPKEEEPVIRLQVQTFQKGMECPGTTVYVTCRVTNHG